jgi:hypothetical protein
MYNKLNLKPNNKNLDEKIKMIDELIMSGLKNIENLTKD